MNPASPGRRYVIAGTEFGREEVIQKYLYLVKYVAGRIAINLPPNIELADLVNDGILGLLDAIEKYDDSRGVKFETYAVTRVHGAILDALRSLDWVPRALRARAREIERAYQELDVRLGRSATEEEVAAHLGLSPKEFDGVMQRIRGTTLLSLEEFLPSERGPNVALGETLPDAGAQVLDVVAAHEIKQSLAQAVDGLPNQERTVISLYYFEGLTLKEIAGVLKVTESRVSQVHSAAVIRLRGKLRSLMDELGYREGDPSVKQKYVRKPQTP